MIRRAGKINEGHEEQVFRPIGWEEFSTNTARLENIPNLAPETNTLLELLRDSIELKKLNSQLMKVSTLEDLVADLYSRLYQLNAPQIAEQASEENKEKLRTDRLIMNGDGAADAPSPTPGTPTVTTPGGPTSETPSQPQPQRGRTKGIARRDIQKRAEAIVARRLTRPPGAAGTTSATATAKPNTEQQSPTTNAPTTGPTSAPVPVSTVTVPDRTVAPPPTTPSTPQPPRPTHEDADPDPGSAPQSSFPGSLHDSADDESELSEMDDEKLSKLGAGAGRRNPLFPGLLEPASADPEPLSEVSELVSGDGGEEGDEAGDGDAEEAKEVDSGSKVDD